MLSHLSLYIYNAIKFIIWRSRKHPSLLMFKETFQTLLPIAVNLPELKRKKPLYYLGNTNARGSSSQQALGQMCSLLNIIDERQTAWAVTCNCQTDERRRGNASLWVIGTFFKVCIPQKYLVQIDGEGNSK